MTDDLSIVWFRRDLRLDDNPAWAGATAQSSTVLALFVLDQRLLGPSGSARRERLFGDLHALQDRLRELGGDLLIRTGDPADVVPAVAAEFSAASVHVNLDVSPFATRRDTAVQAALESRGVRWCASWGTLVHRPGEVRTAAGGLSQVFTPFHRAWARTPWSAWPEPGTATVMSVAGEAIAEVGTYPFVSDQHGEAVMPGEHGAFARLLAAVERADRYDDDRNTPSIHGTSELSADLKFGTLSPRTVARVVGESTPGRSALVRQLAWRDWYAHLLHATPSLVDSPMKPQYAGLAWLDDDSGFIAWTQGRTGFPFVDAGMRQLRATGWMHNRVRMVTASFLVKNLLIDWRRGEQYFRHVLVDADVSQNVGNWQWVAGTGPDASPYNRIFNPVLQGQRFDPAGDYIRTWVPELAGIGGSAIHEPWNLGPLELVAAGITLGEDYPLPIVELGASRQRALAAYGEVRSFTKP